MADHPALEIAELRKEYATDGSAVVALDGVSFDVRAGEFVAIMGASGSGKSTLLHLVGGLDRPTSGTIILEGQDIARMSDRERTLFRRRRIGIIFQSYNLLPTFSALENVTLPAVIDGTDAGDVEQQARHLLDQVDLGKRLTHRPQAMSGGEQQRVAMARALINDPVIVLADEPTGNLDSHHGETIWKLLSAFVRDQGRTVVAVTHEPAGATYADRVLMLSDGHLVGEMEPGGEGHASLVAARYTELVG